MRKLSYKIICVLLAFTTGISLTQIKRALFAANASAVTAVTDAAPRESQPAPEENHPTANNDPERPADFLIAENQWTHDGYTFEKRSRKASLDAGYGPKASPKWVDVNYVVVKKAGKVLGRFDADVYFGLGNSADFGLFPFLGSKTQELFISQDVPRGGCQWVVSLSPRFRIIFDGAKYMVGREGYDLSATDVDGDGVNEIAAPITDFYSFHDKLSMSQVPLPTIIFKYDSNKKEYLPANHLFQTYSLVEATERDELSSPDRTLTRATVLHRLLVYVYAGREKEAWEFYDRAYKFEDKSEIRRRVKSILRKQPVYKFIYNDRPRKS